MLSRKKYINLSLELHLFYTRIMRDHSIFLEAGFTPKNSKLSKQADDYKIQFEKLLADTIKLSNGRVTKDVLNSGELYTEYTLDTERKTEYYTGIEINSKITDMELKMKFNEEKGVDNKILNAVKRLNTMAIKSLDGLIDLKAKVLKDVEDCRIFTSNYPTIIGHLIHEAKLYRSYIYCVENNEDIEYIEIKEAEVFWDNIMMEHSLFIRGLLDPSEGELIQMANSFVREFSELFERAKKLSNTSILEITDETLEKTIKLSGFKKSAVEGMSKCKIKSIMLPLLGDHVLREANHYIRILERYRNKC